MKSSGTPAGLLHGKPFVWAGFAGLFLLIAAACQGGGSSVPACRSDANVEPSSPTPEAQLTLKTGSYEGAGSPQCISGLGFQPVVVIVKGNSDTMAAWHSASMTDGSSADFAIGQFNFDDAITSLDPDAFSVGEHDTVNREGDTYYYVAFAASPDIQVGSYLGDGTTSRTVDSVGFEPALLWIKWDGLRSAVWRSASHPDGVSSFLDGRQDFDGFITSFRSDGFGVSADPWVNHVEPPAGDQIYHYVAFRQAPGLLASGTYVGDGDDDRDITGVGFQPDYVWIKRDSPDSTGVHRPSSLKGDATLRFGGLPSGEDEIQALLSDGFQVGGSNAVNFDGDTYHYVAFKGSP